MFLPSLDEISSECLPLWNRGQVWNWVTWGQKLGHQVKSKENIVNTRGHIFQAIIFNLAQNVYPDDF